MLWEKAVKLEPCHKVKIGDKYYHIISKEYLEYTKTFSSISAGGESDKTTITELEPEKGELYIVKFGVYNPGIEVEVYQPAATGRWGAKARIASITREVSPAEDPSDVTALATIENRPFALKLKNNLNVAIAPSIRFVGFKFKIKEVTDPSEIASLEAKFKEGRLPEIELYYKKE